MPTTTTPEQTYRALSHVADQIGRENWAKVPARQAQKAMHDGERLGVPPSLTLPNWPSQAHRDVMLAMLDVMNGTIDVETAMALIHRSDVEKERFGR